ncbi:MAG: DUF2442 domain-containing protein [Candidatus Kapabacteria bacterium]|nr:DUF2442 domain-containing protein [Ignavibacteriota bacterium]MCW5885652.1 DUF2442 domain-containing protein [Candidatus Kapabacteria bacterium]
MIKITNISHIENYLLKVSFDDNTSKILDFEKILEFKGMAQPLKNIDYFKSVKLLRNGRSFGWDNDYDCCADWAYRY